ncbi:MAG TPA: translation elongation factor EF-1 subunit alpha [Candidatus Nitrosopelagicus sp.]|jgi:elongation factor 1-alpha|nr:translation elongation factor EF-1 subunit alpha [Candidatus Nitrosopelagicus sp.]
MAEKEHLNMIVTGHIDNGKSTTMGHFLMDLGVVDERTIAQHAKESEETGKGDTFKYAWVMDNIKDERARGITIDLAFKKFETPKYFFTLIDAPGHRDFVKNMITGASEADCAILVLSAKEGETDTAVAPGGQAREHAFLLKTLGVSQIILAINKMDDSKFSEDAYKAAKEKGEKLVKSVGYKIENVPAIPISGWTGDNLVKKSENMPWYNGKTLLESFDDFKVPEKPTGKPLRLPIQDVYSITGVGTVPVGRVETGTMKPNDKIIVMPSGAVGEIKSIETHHQEMPSATAGDNIGFNLRGIEKKDIKRGDVLGTPDNPPTVAKEFKAQIIVINHPTAIAPGYTPVMHCHTAQVAATISAFESKINPATGAAEEENPKFLKVGDSAIVRIRPVRPTCIETFQEFPEMGRFALRDMGSTIAAGIVKEITEKADK